MALIIPFITGLILLYANIQSLKKLRKNIHGQFILKLNPTYKWLGFISCLIGSFLLNMAIINWNDEIAVMATIAISLFFGLGIMVLIWYYNYKLIFDDIRIIATNWKGYNCTIKWTDVKDIKFNSILGCLKLYSKSEKIIIHQHSTGFVGFLRLMELKTSFTAKKLKIKL